MAAFRLDPSDGAVSGVTFLDFPPRRAKGVEAAATASTPGVDDDEGLRDGHVLRHLTREQDTVGWAVGGSPERRAA